MHTCNLSIPSKSFAPDSEVWSGLFLNPVFLTQWEHIIERFHSRDYLPYWFTETKESICIKIEFNSQRLSLGHQHSCHFFVLDTNMAVVTSCENTLTIRRIQREVLQYLEKVSSSMCPSLSINFLCPKYLFSPVQDCKMYNTAFIQR